MNHLDRQAKSRERLRRAVVDYMKLRAADGEYDDTIHTVDRLGHKVTVFLKLNIISDEG